MKKGYVELANARQVKETEKAVLLDYVDVNGAKKQGWFPKKAIALEGKNFGVAIWFQKKISGVETPKKTELVNRFEKKRLIQPQGDKVDCLIQVGEYAIKCYEEYRKGSANSGLALTEAFKELVYWIEENKNSKPKVEKKEEPKFFGNVDKVLDVIVN